MILRAIIVDDEFKGISTLKTLIEEHVTDVKVIAETTDALEAIRMIEDYKPEIVFLDINMPGMDGFDLLERLNWKTFNLVFTTAHQEYALKALKHNAIDYILKPIDHEEVELAVRKIRKIRTDSEAELPLSNYTRFFQDLNALKKNKIAVSLKTGIEAISINEIMYLESKSNYTRLYLTNDTVVFTSSKTLKEFDNMLCNKSFNFMRVHYSFIINLQKVTRYLKSEEVIVLNGDQKIPLSKSKKDLFYSWLNFK